MDILQGGGTAVIWSYDIFDQWWRKLPSFGQVTAGGSLSFKFNGCDYGFIGGGTPVFFNTGRFCPTTGTLSNTPAPVGAGAAVTTAPGLGGAPADSVFAIRGGGTTAFWSYSISAATWTTLPATPGPVDEGAAAITISAIYWGLDYAVPVLAGGGSREFWMYSIRDQLWIPFPDTPAPIGPGGALAWKHGPELYALRGGGATDFWKFDASGAWTPLSPTPGAVGAGGGLVGINYGTRSGGAYIYGLQGGGSATVWRYDTFTDSWTTVAALPLDNTAPIANAGPDHTIAGTGSCSVSVQLDASGSADPDGDRLEFEWREGNQLIALTRDPVRTAFLSGLGEHILTLKVMDSRGGETTDTLRVTIVDEALQLRQQVERLNRELAIAEAEGRALHDTITDAMAAVENNLRQRFSDPQFAIPGATPVERLRSLVQAMLALNDGRAQGLHQYLSGR